MDQFLVVIFIKIDQFAFHAFLTTNDLCCVGQLSDLFKKLGESPWNTIVFHCVTNGVPIKRGEFQTPPTTLIFDSGSSHIGLAGYSQELPEQFKGILVDEEWLDEFESILNMVNQL